MSILARNVVFRVLSPITEVEKFLSDYSCVKGILINVIYIQGLKKNEIRSVDATGSQSGCGNNMTHQQIFLGKLLENESAGELPW